MPSVYSNSLNGPESANSSASGNLVSRKNWSSKKVFRIMLFWCELCVCLTSIISFGDYEILLVRKQFILGFKICRKSSTFILLEIVENDAFNRKSLGCYLGSKKGEDYLQVWS
jgi:hypothetical protein